MSARSTPARTAHRPGPRRASNPPMPSLETEITLHVDGKPVTVTITPTDSDDLSVVVETEFPAIWGPTNTCDEDR